VPVETRSRARYEACEDLAAALTEHAGTVLWQQGVAEDDILRRIHRGLREPGSGVSPAEAGWVGQRLAELLGWACDLDELRSAAKLWTQTVDGGNRTGTLREEPRAQSRP
jgi:hypothetical protein